MTLLHWREPSRACWVPLLDTKLLPRLASGRKHENYFPVAVADNKFHCIILKGGDQYPYFPRPLLSEFEFSIPLTSAPSSKKKKKKSKKQPRKNPDDEDEEMLSPPPAEESDADADGAEEEEEEDPAEAEALALAQGYLLKSLRSAQLADTLAHTRSTASQRAQLARLELDMDKTLIQMLAAECRAGGEERGMRALDIVRLMRDRSGRMIEAAIKVAERYGRDLLASKIREWGEKRIAGGADGDAGEDEDEDNGDGYGF